MSLVGNEIVLYDADYDSNNDATYNPSDEEECSYSDSEEDSSDEDFEVMLLNNKVLHKLC